LAVIVVRHPHLMAPAPPTLRSAQIKHLAKLLDGPTGGELGRDLVELRLPMGTESTKWRMLRESFQLAQRRDGHGGSVLRFVKQALDPAHELATGTLSELRTSVNEILLLSGLELLDDGRLVARQASRTADDARARADALRAKLTGRIGRVRIGTERMGDVELTLGGEMMRERYLADALAGHIGDYDLVLVDCPPNLGLLTVNAFCAAPEVLVVVSMTDRNAYKGAMALLATVEKLRRKSVDVAVTGVMRNNVDRHRSTYRLLNEALVEARLPLLRTEVPLRADFQNAVTAGVPLVRFSPDHVGAQAIRDIAGELTISPTRAKAA